MKDIIERIKCFFMWMFFGNSCEHLWVITDVEHQVSGGEVPRIVTIHTICCSRCKQEEKVEKL